MNSPKDNQTTPVQVFTYLEFGSIDPFQGGKQVYDFRVKEKAYDWLMHARYSNDIFAYKQMTDALVKENFAEVIELFKSEVHHENDFIINLNKKIALDVTSDSFLELGQTLFGCIDSIEFINQLEAFLSLKTTRGINLTDITWYGLDISAFFNFMAKKMHEKYKVNTAVKLSDMAVTYDVFFAKGITLLYAINSASELFDFVSKAKIAVFDYSVSLGEQEDSYIGTGKPVRFLSKVEFDSFYQMVRETGKDIWVRGNSKADVDNNRLYIEGIICDERHALDFIKKQTDWILTMQVKLPNLYSGLVHNKTPEYWTWSKLSDNYR
jgi:hypothetical protein